MGGLKITVGDKQLDLRVSIIPTNHGQSCVMRLLDKDNIKVGVRQLGLSARDYRTFNNLIRRPNGSSWSPGQPDLEKPPRCMLL